MRNFLLLTLMTFVLGGCHQQNIASYGNQKPNIAAMASGQNSEQNAQLAVAVATQKSEKDRCLETWHENNSAMNLERCFNRASLKFSKAVNFPYMDLIYAQNSYMLKIAKKVDDGELHATALDDADAEYLAKNREIVRERENEKKRIEIEKLRAEAAYIQALSPQTEQSSSRYDSPSNSSPAANYIGSQAGDNQQVYSPNECIGAIVNGECHGSIQSNTAYHQTCHGQMLNGQCTGPMF